MDKLGQCFPCAALANNKADVNGTPPALQEKQPIITPYSDDPAQQVVHILRTAEKAGPELEAKLRDVVSTSGWTEHIAERILRGIENLVLEGAKMAAAMAKAVDKAKDTAWEFAKDHPYYSALIAAGTIVAIGVLISLAPWVLEALGFTLRGPRAASFAARWMSRIARGGNGGVPKSSLYAYLQRLGMIWKK